MPAPNAREFQINLYCRSEKYRIKTGLCNTLSCELQWLKNGSTLVFTATCTNTVEKFRRQLCW